jgi:lysine/ornithine N-monooxygenase
MVDTDNNIIEKDYVLESDKNMMIGCSQSAAELLQFNIFKSYEED